MKKVVISGSNGFIGSNLVKLLMNNNFDVKCLVRKGSDFSNLPKNADISFVDYNELEKLRSIIKGYEIFIHLAAVTKARKWKTFQKINIDLTSELIKIVNQEESIKHFIFFSSQAACGPALSYDNPKKESDICDPVSMYGKSKLLAEHFVLGKCKKNWTIVRPAAIYGPADKDFINYFKMIKNHISVKIGKNDRFFNLIYVDDLTKTIMKMLNNEKTYNTVFFAAGGVKYSMREFSEALERALPSFAFTIHINIGWLKIAALLNEIFSTKKHFPTLNREKVKEIEKSYWLVSNDRIVKMLDFSEQNTLIDNLKTTYKWYKEHKWIK